MIIIIVLATAIFIGAIKFQVESILEEQTFKEDNKVETESKQ